MLARPRHIIQHCSTCAAAHYDVAHFDLQGVTFQIDRFLLQRKFPLLGRFLIAVIFNNAICMTGADGQFYGSLLQRHAQTGHQLLVNLCACLHAAQDRHRIMDDRPLIVLRPRRIFLPVVICPRLREKLRKRIAQATVVEYDLRYPRESDKGAPYFLCQCVLTLTMIGAHIYQFFKESSIFQLNQLDHTDHSVICGTLTGGRQVNAHHIIRGAAGRLNNFHLLECPAAFRQVIGVHTAGFLAHKAASIFHGKLSFGHFPLLLEEELHIRDAHTGSAPVVLCTSEVGCTALRKLFQRRHEHGVEIVGLETGRSDGHSLAGIVRNSTLMADVTLCIAHGANDSIKIISLYLGRLVDNDDLGAVAAHGAHGIAFDLASILLCANALVAGQLHRTVTITLDLPHDLRILDEVVLNLLYDQSGLLCRARHDSDQTAGVQNTDGNTALRRQPGLSVAAGLDHHDSIRIAHLTGNHLLGILLLDPQILLNEHIQMCTPEHDLHRPQLDVPDIPDLCEDHTDTCS